MNSQISKVGISLGEAKYNEEYASKRIFIADPENIPSIYIMVSACRSGSTAILESLSRSKAPSFYQPIKDILRYGKPDFVIPSSKFQKKIFIKETFGPARDIECLFNPVNVLIMAGVPSDKIKVRVLFRNPLEVYSSWKATYNGIEIDMFLKAYLNSGNQIVWSKKHNIDVDVINYNDFESDVDDFKESLCNLFDINIKEYLFEWGEEPTASVDSLINISTPMQGAYNVTVKGNKLKFIDRKVENLSSEELELINSTTLNLYKKYCS